MAFYELVFVLRQDILLQSAEKVAQGFEEIVKKGHGTIVKQEFWGLRYLAYRIRNNKRGYYFFLGIEAHSSVLTEIRREIRFSESVIRSSIVAVDVISEDPSPILADSAADKVKVPDAVIQEVVAEAVV